MTSDRTNWSNMTQSFNISLDFFFFIIWLLMEKSHNMVHWIRAICSFFHSVGPLSFQQGHLLSLSINGTQYICHCQALASLCTGFFTPLLSPSSSYEVMWCFTNFPSLPNRISWKVTSFLINLWMTCVFKLTISLDCPFKPYSL